MNHVSVKLILLLLLSFWRGVRWGGFRFLTVLISCFRACTWSAQPTIVLDAGSILFLTRPSRGQWINLDQQCLLFRMKHDAKKTTTTAATATSLEDEGPQTDQVQHCSTITQGQEDRRHKMTTFQ